MNMRRLLTWVTVALLGVAAAQLAATPTFAANASPPIVPRHITVAASPPPTIPVTAPDDDGIAAAEKAKQAMQTVLPTAQVGFAVFDRHRGTELASYNADQQFASMSLVKLLIALDVLASDNWVLPNGATQQKLRRMLADSNDGIASTMWAANGGPAIVTRMASLLGLTGTQPPENPGRWGNTLITAQDVVTVYRYITDELPSPSRDVLLAALAAAPPIAADGFDQYFGIPDGMPNTTWAVKQGWGTSGSKAVMTSTGLVGTDFRYVVVVLASAPARSYSTVPAVVTAGAGTLADLVNSGP
jgi:hypothetical protein